MEKAWLGQRWINNHSVAHTSTSTSDPVVWDSGTLNTGDSFEFQFNSEGDFPYDCTFHPSMTGTITVIGANADGGDDGGDDPPDCILDCPGFENFEGDVELCEWITEIFPDDPCFV